MVCPITQGDHKNLHQDHTMCRSMVDIQSPTAEIRRGEKEEERRSRRRRNRMKLECGPMLNVMVALPNTQVAPCFQSLADAHYQMPCSNAAKTRNPLKFAGVPQTTGWISAVSRPSSPYCGDMWRTYRCLTSFFSDCRYVPQLRRYSPTKLCDGDFFASCISSQPRVAGFRPAS